LTEDLSSFRDPKKPPEIKIKGHFIFPDNWKAA
jgi:hypothetical protein